MGAEASASSESIASGLLMNGCRVFQGYSYPSDGGYGASSVSIGGAGNPNMSGSFRLIDCDLVGPVGLTSPFDFIEASGNIITHRPSTSVDTHGFSNLDKSTTQLFDDETVELAVGNNEATSIKNRTYIEANEFEFGRFLVTVYNWEDDSEVALDLSDVCVENTRYSITELQRSLLESRDFVYTGQPVAVDMTRPPVAPIGGSISDGKTLDKRERTFMIRKVP